MKYWVKKILRTFLLAPIALLLLFEEWGWEPLAARFTALAKLPWWARLERLIIGLPPGAALLVFGLPVLTLLPVKLLALYWFGQGHVMLGTGLIIAAKIVGTALAARLFQLTHPALMQLKWFARLYTPWKIWKDRVLVQLRHSWFWRSLRRLRIRVKALSLRCWMAVKSAAADR